MTWSGEEAATKTLSPHYGYIWLIGAPWFHRRTVVTIIIESISPQHQLHRQISVTSWAGLFSLWISRTKWYFCGRIVANSIFRHIYNNYHLVKYSYWTNTQSTVVFLVVVVVIIFHFWLDGSLDESSSLFDAWLNLKKMASNRGILIPIVGLPLALGPKKLAFFYLCSTLSLLQLQNSAGRWRLEGSFHIISLRKLGNVALSLPRHHLTNKLESSYAEVISERHHRV